MFLCGRCQNHADIVTMSYFDAAMICAACEAVEREHPRHALAVAAENAAVREGDMHFPGIGVPDDLAPWCGAGGLP